MLFRSGKLSSVNLFLSVSFGHIEQARAWFWIVVNVNDTHQWIDWPLNDECGAECDITPLIPNRFFYSVFFVIFRIFLFCQKETFSSPRFCIANRRRTHLTEVRCELVSDSFDQSTNIWAKNRLVIFKAHKYALYSCLEFRFFSWSSYLKKKWNQVKCDGKIDFFV